MVVKKTFKKPMAESSVKVETKKHVNEEKTCCCNVNSNPIILLVLLLVNLVLLVALVLKPSAKDIEIMKAWWKENYAIMEQIFSLDQFKSQQKVGLEQALAQFQATTEQPQFDLNTVENTTDETAEIVE